MNVQEIYDLAVKTIGDTTLDITVNDAIVWLNECSDDLAEVARKRTRLSIPYQGGSRYPVPPDSVRVLDVYWLGSPLKDMTLYPQQRAGYYIEGSDIIFEPALDPSPTATGQLDIVYYRRLPTLTQPTDTPDIPAQFHRLYVLWLTARIWENLKQFAVAQAKMNEYASLRYQFDSYTAYQDGQPVRTKDVMYRPKRRTYSGLDEWVKA